ncbi:MAG: sigma-70 family RNA polymerase sigma factor [Ruminococcaceae bacterium]|nr:sigma-70 family RNA polymerase sigma factor [Oscillospiraceae bacterium]
MFFLIINTNEESEFVSSLYLKYRNLLFYVANKIVNNEASAEDIVMETIVRAIENLHNIDPNNEKRTRNYLALICKHIADDFVRDKDNSQISIDAEDFREQKAKRGNPQEIYISKETFAIIMEAIHELPEKYRIVLLMKRVQKLSVEQIASSLKLKPDTVVKQTHRAKKMLDRKLIAKGVLDHE